jgi:hypothetical protein
MCRGNSSLFKTGKNNDTLREERWACTTTLFSNLPWLSWIIKVKVKQSRYRPGVAQRVTVS